MRTLLLVSTVPLTPHVTRFGGRCRHSERVCRRKAGSHGEPDAETLFSITRWRSRNELMTPARVRSPPTTRPPVRPHRASRNADAGTSCEFKYADLKFGSIPWTSR